MNIIFMITERCNCKCFFCSRNNLSLEHKEIDIDGCYKSFDILSSAYPSSKIIISGGEPTLSKHFFSILDYACQRFEKVEIQTNGTFDEFVADKLLPYLDKNVYVQFSLDGTQGLHDSVRGKGTFKKVVGNLLRLEGYSSHLSISTTVTPMNMNGVLELAEYLNNHKFRRLTVSYVQPLEPLKEPIVSAESWNKFVDELLVRCYYRVDVIKLYDFQLMDRFCESGQEWHGVVNCGRGVTHFYVKPNFDVLPCTCTDYQVGNLLSDSINDIRKRLSEKEKATIRPESVCAGCKYLHMCNGGCPGLSLKVFGSEGMGDIRCPEVYNFAERQGLFVESV